MADGGYRDLLIVQTDGNRFVVEAPIHEANVGNLIVFDTEQENRIGFVIDKMWCELGDDRDRCMSLMNRIYHAKEIYRKVWAAEEQNDT